MSRIDQSDGTIILDRDDTVTAHIIATVRVYVSVTGLRSIEAADCTDQDVEDALKEYGIEGDLESWEVDETEVE